jgi:hypothetical protein
MFRTYDKLIETIDIRQKMSEFRLFLGLWLFFGYMQIKV